MNCWSPGHSPSQTCQIVVRGEGSHSDSSLRLQENINSRTNRQWSGKRDLANCCQTFIFKNNLKRKSIFIPFTLSLPNWSLLNAQTSKIKIPTCFFSGLKVKLREILWEDLCFMEKKICPCLVVCVRAGPGFPSSSNFNFKPLRGGGMTNYGRKNMIL